MKSNDEVLQELEEFAVWPGRDENTQVCVWMRISLGRWASHPCFGTVLALWDVFLHLVCLQFMGKITNQQFLWTGLLYVVTYSSNVWMFDTWRFMRMFFLFFKKQTKKTTSLYLWNKIANQMKRASATQIRCSKPISPSESFPPRPCFSPALHGFTAQWSGCFTSPQDTVFHFHQRLSRD